jgi:hypothetical protein
MRLGKTKMFFLLNGIAFSILLIYFAPWLFSETVTGKVITPYESTIVHVEYVVNNKNYFGSFMRNGIEFSQRDIPVRYLSFNPSASRINSFMGLWAEPLAWWGVFLLASAMLLLTHNTVFSKGTIFQFHKKFPWISMEEYFPLEGGWYDYWQAGRRAQQEGNPENASVQKRDTYLGR